MGLVLMVPVSSVGSGAPGSPSTAAYTALATTAAFKSAGMAGWRAFILVTALLGVLTSLITLPYSCSRVVMVGARDWLLPPQLASISRRTQTPAVAQLTMGSIIGGMAGGLTDGGQTDGDV